MRPVVVAGAMLVSCGVGQTPILAQRRSVVQNPDAPRAGAPRSGAPAPFALSIPPAQSPGLNVLIIALDDPSLTPATGVPADAPLTATPFYPDVPLTALPPARTSWSGTAPASSWSGTAPASSWSVLAKKKPPKPDPRFLPLPDPPTKTTPDAYGLGSGTQSGSGAPAPSAGVPPAGVSLPPAPLPPPRSNAPAGKAMLAAASLRRALLGLGYAQVDTTSPGSLLALGAPGEKRLSPRVLSALRGAMKSLAATRALPEVERAGAIDKASQLVGDAAASVGQATGYRAVVALCVGPLVEDKTPFALVLDDSTRENSEPILWSETAKDDALARESGALTGAALIHKSLRVWPAVSPTSTRELADAHLARARLAGAGGNLALAQDEVARVVTLDPSRAEAYTFLGDLLSSTDPAGAAAAYRRGTGINQKDGNLFAKMALAYINSPTPDFPRVLEAGRAAIQNGVDTSDVRVAMARAQLGRAGLFRAASHAGSLDGNDNPNYIMRAEDAEAEAQVHLDRALQLSPSDPNALKIMAFALITGGRTSEGVQALDRVAPLFPQDIDLQFQYANALLAVPNRKEDAFVAYSRVWKARGQAAANLPESTIQLLLQGFDQHVFGLGKAGRQLSDGVANGNIAREGAYLQLKRFKDDMDEASDSLGLLRPPAGNPGAAMARSFAASLMVQSLANQQTFLDTGQETYRTRAGDLFRQAVAQLNSARLGR